MNVTIQESPPVAQRHGIGFADVFAVSLFVALVFGLVGLVVGLQLGRQETDREIHALKLRHGIVGDAVPGPASALPPTH